MDGKWPIHVYPIWKDGVYVRVPSKELVLTWIDRAWNGIPQDLTEKSFKSCVIANALDGSEDNAVWEEENEETEDAEEIIDNEFETVREGKEGE